MDRYEKGKHTWDELFKKERLNTPQKRESGNEEFDRSLSWLLKEASSVIDFGCGSGTILFLCSQYGTRSHIGIDLSQQAILNAQEKLRISGFTEQPVPAESLLAEKDFRFICGGVEALFPLESSSLDAAVLSNIIDNLYPEDAHRVLAEIRRILRPGGRLLVKMNPLLTREQIAEYGIRVIKDNLLDDGMLLWNNTTEEWDRILNSYFCTDLYKTIYYKEHEQYNRLWQLVRP